MQLTFSGKIPSEEQSLAAMKWAYRNTESVVV